MKKAIKIVILIIVILLIGAAGYFIYNRFLVKNQFTLSASASTSEGGRVSIYPVKEKYNLNDQVGLIALPNDGYVFVAWSGDVRSGNNQTSLIMDSNKTTTANFLRAYTITASVYPEGAGDVFPKSEIFPSGTNVILRASSSPGYIFSGWSGGFVSGKENPISIILDSNKSAIANFTKKNKK